MVVYVETKENDPYGDLNYQISDYTTETTEATKSHASNINSALEMSDKETFLWTLAIVFVLALVLFFLQMTKKVHAASSSDKIHQHFWLVIRKSKSVHTIQSQKDLVAFIISQAAVSWSLNSKEFQSLQHARRFVDVQEATEKCNNNVESLVNLATELQTLEHAAISIDSILIRSPGDIRKDDDAMAQVSLPGVFSQIGQTMNEILLLKSELLDSGMTNVLSQIQQLYSKVEVLERQVKKLRSKWTVELQTGVSELDWKKLRTAKIVCEGIGILQVVVADEKNSSTITSASPETSSAAWFNQIVRRAMTKHRVIKGLQSAVISNDESTLKKAIRQCHDHSLAHLPLARTVQEKLDTLIDERHEAELCQAVEQLKIQSDERMLLLNAEQKESSSSNNDKNISSATVDQSKIVEDLVTSGIDRQEALKLVASKLADRGNVILNIKAQFQLAERQEAESRRQHAEKAKLARELSRQQLEHECKLHREKMEDSRKRDELKLKSRIASAKKAAEEAKLLEISRFNREEAVRQQECKRTLKLSLNAADRAHVALVSYLDLCLMLLVFTVVFYDSMSPLASVFETSVNCNEPPSSWYGKLGYFASPQVFETSCEMIVGIKMLGAVAAVALMFIALGPTLATTALGSIVLYVFRSRWKLMVLRVPWIGLLIGFNQLVRGMLLYDKNLHWTVPSFSALDLRLVFKYLFFPLMSFALTIFVSIRIACADPWNCASVVSDLFQQALAQVVLNL